ncbi:MAG: HlyC/CorC family transporter [Ileibacterium sp.]|nr:HlyC/CorC family transporter [Ileibacterium sp.]
MNSDIGVQITLLVVLLVLSAVFSSAETSLVGVSKMRIRSLADEGNKKAQDVLKLYEEESKMLSAILIGNNLVNTFMASIASMIAYNFGGYAVSIATFLITFLILVFGEITPKTLATRYAEKMALFYAPIILVLTKILTPVIWFINLFSKLILGLLGVKSDQKAQSITESELHTILDVSHEEGVIEAEERQMIKNVFDFTDAKAREIMVPRVHVSAVDLNCSYEDLIDAYRRERFTRIPVYEGSIDNIIGIVNMKDLILYDPKKPFVIQDYLRKPYFTVENKPIADLLQEMQKDAFNMAVVLDEYGEMAGILTVEDIVEEIVGEVQDEYDAYENDNIRKIGENTWQVRGYISLHDLNDELSLDLDSEDFDSVGGLIIEKLGHLPSLSEKITLENGVVLKVSKLNKNRIEEVLIKIPEAQEEKDDPSERK